MAHVQRPYRPLGILVGVILLLGFGHLLVQSGPSTPNATPTSQPSDTLGTAAPPSGAAGGTSPSGGAGTARQAPEGAGGAGSAGIQGAEPSAPLPNTGPPFPWWLGLLPVSLGLGLIAALRRRPVPTLVPVPRGGRGRAVPPDAGTPLRAPSELQEGEQWFPSLVGEFDDTWEVDAPATPEPAFYTEHEAPVAQLDRASDF